MASTGCPRDKFPWSVRTRTHARKQLSRRALHTRHESGSHDVTVHFMRPVRTLILTHQHTAGGPSTHDKKCSQNTVHEGSNAPPSRAQASPALPAAPRPRIMRACVRQGQPRHPPTAVGAEEQARVCAHDGRGWRGAWDRHAPCRVGDVQKRGQHFIESPLHRLDLLLGGLSHRFQLPRAARQTVLIIAFGRG